MGGSDQSHPLEAAGAPGPGRAQLVDELRATQLATRLERYSGAHSRSCAYQSRLVAVSLCASFPDAESRCRGWRPHWVVVLDACRGHGKAPRGAAPTR